MAKFRKPNEMEASEGRVPVSLRVKKSIKERLTKEAKSAKMPLAELLENVLEDYVRFLDNRK